MVPSEIIYNLLLGSPGQIMGKLKFEATRGIYVGVDLDVRAQTAFL